MNLKRSSLFLLILLSSCLSYGQTKLKEFKAGHSFTIALPEYMSKTTGINGASAIQYKSVVKDVYGFVIFDTKEELQLADMNFSSIDEFYENFISDFLIDQEKRKISKPKSKSQGDTKFIECDLTYYDKEAEMEIYYLVGIVETKTSFYKVLSWSAADKKEKFRSDFQAILYSLKD